MYSRRLCAIAIVIVTFTSVGGARRIQSPGSGAFAAVGAQPERGYFSQLPFERVDMVNGNLSLSFTDLVLPGNAGMDLRITRTYNHQSTLGSKWTFGFGGIPQRVSEPAHVPPDTWNPRLIMADGSEQPLHQGIVSGFWITTDFSRYDASTRTLYMPNGWIATYTSDAAARLDEVHDPFGNAIQVNWQEWTSGLWRITSVVQTVPDAGATRTRTVSFGYGGGTGYPPTSMTYDGKTWDYEYGDSIHKLTRVQPPTGPDWEFAYNLSGNDGTITVTTSAGGTVQYEFDEQDLTGNRSVLRTLTTGGRAITGGSWSFEYAVSGSTATSAVTTPGSREIEFVHQHRSGANGFEWTLEGRSVSNGQSVVSSLAREYRGITFGGHSLWAVDEQTISRDGVTFTTGFDYNSSNFGDYRRPIYIAETASNHSTSRITNVTFGGSFTSYILPKVTQTTVTVGGESFASSAGYNAATGFMESQTVFGITTSFASDAFGNVATVTDAHNHQTSTGYQWGVPSVVATPEYTITRYVNGDGSVGSETRDGKTTYFAYDALGRVTVVTPASGTAIQTSYASDGSSTTVTRGSSWSTTVVDGFGRPIGSENAEGTKSSATFDTEGFKTFQSAPFTGSSGTGDAFTFDMLGRVTSVTHADGSDVTYGYSGTSVTITDENNRATTQHWQMFGSPSGGRLASLVDADAQTWTYSYNAPGSLTLVDPPAGPNRSWTYNSSNQLTSESQPESGTTTFTYTSGLLTGKTDARGQASSYVYDSNHRLLQILAPVSAETVTFEYDDSDNQTRMLTGGLETLFSYDTANRLTNREDRINGRVFTTQYEYDGRDNLTKITYPSGRAAQYLYDYADRITKVYAGSTTYAEDLMYHATGAMTSADFGNGRTESLTLNSRFRPEHLVSGPLDVTYGYDAGGNVSSIDDARSGYDSSFSYDYLDRLTSVSGFGATSFTYDAQGNRLTKGSGSTGVSYAYNPSTNRLSTATSSVGAEAGTFGYDNAGNMTTDGTGTYTYSSRNIMKTAAVAGATTTYDYDAAGLRVIKSGPGSVRYYVRGLGSQVLAEYDATSGTPVLSREYIYLGSKLLASFTETVPTPALSTQLTAPSAGTVSPSDVVISLAAAASISGGGSITSVQFYANGILLGSDASAPYTLSWTPTVAGTFKLTSRAVASTGKVANSVPAAITIDPIGRVLGVSTSPISPIVGQQTTVTVSGNAYTCGAVQVDLGNGSGPATYPLSAPLAVLPLVIPNVTWSGAGVKTITASGQSTCQGVIPHNVTVTVNSGPSVSLTAPTAGEYTTGSSVTLSAAASDPHGVAYVEFHSGSTLVATDSSAPYSVNWTAVEGSHSITARAVDTHSVATVSSSVAITVEDVYSVVVQPSPPLIGQAAVVSVYGAPTGCGAVQVNYGDGDVITYAIDGLPIHNYHTWTSAGQKTIIVTGFSNCSGTAQTTVTLNAAPAVTLTTPVNNDFFAAPATVNIAATASDSDGSITHVRFYAGSTLLETDTSSPYSYAWSGMANGTYSITAVATDNQGSTTTSAAASINIGTPPASTVTGVSVSPSPGTVNSTVTITVVGGNPCGAVALFYGNGDWQYLPIESLPYQRAYDYTSQGTFTVTASGQGNCSGQASTQITITGEAPTVVMTQSSTTPRARPAWSAITDQTARRRGTRPSIVASQVEFEGDEAAALVDHIHAVAAPVTVTVDIAPGASGTVTSAPSGFNCTGQDTSCAASFEAGTSVTLTATPSSGHSFLGWGGACAGTSTCVISATSGHLVVAAFSNASSATISYYHTDVLGSVRAITNASGGEVTRHDYFPFGESTSALSGDPRRFTGLERDAESAFDYVASRYYRNVWGRFTTADDPKFIDPLNPQSFNLYAYVLNNPLRWVDPSGHQAQCPTNECVTVTATSPDSERELNAQLWRLEGLLDFFMESERRFKESMRAAMMGVRDLLNFLGQDPVRTAAQDFVRAAAPSSTEDFVAGIEGLKAAMLVAAPVGKGARIVRGFGNITHASPISAAAALRAGERWVGAGYREIGPGVFRSADGLRQFRMTTSDLLPTHGNIGGHVHFESFAKGGTVPLENLHVPIIR